MQLYLREVDRELIKLAIGHLASKLYTWGHDWGSSGPKVLSLIAHIVSCST